VSDTSTPVSDPASVYAHSREARRDGASLTWRYRLQRILVKGVVHTLFRVEAEGLEHWPPGPFQLVTNHHSGWDPLLVGSIAPTLPRITWFGPKEVHFSKGFRNRMIAFFNTGIPFHPRHTDMRAVLRAVQYTFDAGGVLGITPEGTLGFKESELLPLQDGTTLFAARSGVPIVPGAIVGSTTIWFRKRIVVRFGEPIPVHRTEDRAEREALAEQVRAAMLALLPDVEPVYPRRRPMGDFLSDLFNGAAEVRKRRAHMASLEDSRPD
jgi:1-acyl-sn-glycerol-3-phosphate acyltransferase